MPMLKMEPACKDYLWGGECLREKYHIRADCHPLAEAWMLSCHPDGPSRIAQGPCKGMTLADYAAACGSGFWGKRCESFAQFPMLIKLIDAAKDLSVQVHPGDRYARRHEHQPGKAEMWYVLEAEPGAAVYYGFARAVTRKEIRRSLQDNTLTKLLQRVPVSAGDRFFIPPGTVHAIGAGILMAEIQQNSNVTYRLYDYGRLDADGYPRPLQIEQALAVLEPGPVASTWKRSRHLASCPSFTVDLLRGEAAGCCDGESFCSFLFTAGSGELCCGGQTEPVTAGECWLLPAGSGEWQLRGNTTALLCYLL